MAFLSWGIEALIFGSFIIFALGSFTSLLKNSRSFSYFTLLPKYSLKVARILDDKEMSLVSNIIPRRISIYNLRH